MVARRIAGHAGLALAFVVLALTACGIVVEGELRGRPLSVDLDPRQVIVVIWNHGFSPEAAGTYRPEAPAIIERLVERNRDVVLFTQLRNATWLGELDDRGRLGRSGARRLRREAVIPDDHDHLARIEVHARAPGARPPPRCRTRSARQHDEGEREARVAGDPPRYHGIDWPGLRMAIRSSSPRRSASASSRSGGSAKAAGRN